MGKQVKVIVSTPTNYRPPMNEAGTGVPSTPLAGGAPTMAPSQTMAVTGGGPISEDNEGFQGQGGLAAPPASHSSTNQIEGGPSVDYDSQQQTPSNLKVVHHPNSVTPLGEQDQRT